ncbi:MULTISPECIES: hypothetical protein [unclassified Kitasatospora]|uniref:hypothetical protein n=1 Tax=unclassified Kitasatospora TaxID=2633591 RepID=UPI0033C3C7ED
MSRRAAWQEPAWFTRPALRFAFQRGIETCGVTTRVVKPPHRYRGGFALAVRLDLPDIPRQTITIAFGLYPSQAPHIYSDGPSESPHRYNDGSLCIWYPYDPAEQRWVLRDGPTVLLGLIIAHLLKEEWWRRTGEWPGQEAPHLMPEPNV